MTEEALFKENHIYPLLESASNYSYYYTNNTNTKDKQVNLLQEEENQKLIAEGNGDAISKKAEKLDVILSVVGRTNYMWRGHCSEIGLTREKLYEIFQKTRRMIVSADMLLVFTFF